MKTKSLNECAGFPQITLTRGPVIVPESSIFSGLLVPPIGLAYLAGCLRQAGYQVTIVDPVGEDPFDINSIPGHPLVTYGWSIDKIVDAIPEKSKYIGLSFMFSHEWPISKQLSERIRGRFPNAVIIAGGEHMTAAAKFCLRDCPSIDYVVVGEGEDTIVELINVLEKKGDVSQVAGIRYLENGTFSRTAIRKRVTDVDDIPWPAWDLVPLENYLKNGLSYGVSPGRTVPIMATRGCPFKCTFCSSPSMWTQRWYPRSAKDVADEIEHYTTQYKAENFDFYDLTAIVRKNWIVEFCNQLIERKLNITWQLPAGTRSEAIDAEVADLLARSGHRNIVYAPESGSERMLNIILKKVTIKTMLKSMRVCIKNGISVKMNLIVGFPEDKPADILKTYLFLIRSAWAGVDDATISTFIPYPGSAMFEDLKKAGKITEMNDEFFYGLTSMGDHKKAISYADAIGGKALIIYKMLGIFLFYGFSYGVRPLRFPRTLLNIYKHDHKTRIEKALSAYVDRRRESKGIAVATSKKQIIPGICILSFMEDLLFGLCI